MIGKEPVSPYCVNLTPEQGRKLDAFAAANKVSKSEVMRQALDEFLDGDAKA